jgi:hypothetical protein
MAKLVLVKLKCTGPRPEFKFQPHFNKKNGPSIGNPITIHPNSPNVVDIPQNNNNPYNVSLFKLNGARLFLVDLDPNPDQPHEGGLLDATIGIGKWTPFDAPVGYDIEVFYTIRENAFSLTQSYLGQLYTLVSTFTREIAIATAIYFSSLFTVLTLPFRRSRLDEGIGELSNDAPNDSQDRSQDNSRD